MSDWDNNARRKNNTFFIFDDYIVVKDDNGRQFVVDHVGYVKGVHQVKRSGKWQSRIAYKGKRIVLGTFDNFDDAVKARKDAEELYYGEFNRTEV